MTSATLKKNMLKALKCLYIAVESHVADDVNKKVMAYVSDLEKRLEETEKSCKELAAAELKMREDYHNQTIRFIKSRNAALEEAARVADNYRIVDDWLASQIAEEIRKL